MKQKKGRKGGRRRGGGKKGKGRGCKGKRERRRER